jgi:uncharacterized membrane protein
VIFIAVGAIDAVLRLLPAFRFRRLTHGVRRDAWLSLARWLVVGLEFMLAADIVDTIAAPSWNDVGKLAAIAAIRTFLNYFLEKDIGEAHLLPDTTSRHPDLS